MVLLRWMIERSLADLRAVLAHHYLRVLDGLAGFGRPHTRPMRLRRNASDVCLKNKRKVKNGEGGVSISLPCCLLDGVGLVNMPVSFA